MASYAFAQVFFFFFLISMLHGHVGASAPAMYVFGDSLADVGNNDYLDFTLLKADFPHNGVDYPGRKATGRFSNGKNAADFLAEKLGVTSPPPYLSINSKSNKTQVFLNGVNFASGGAGLFDSTNKDQCISFTKQIDYYSIVYATLSEQLGGAQAQSYFSKCVFSFIIGSNDIFGYINSNSDDKAKTTPQQFADSMVSTLQGQLKRLYNLGGRKVVFVGAGPIGCSPSQRIKNGGGECYQEANTVSQLYNEGAASLLQQMKSSLGDLNYSFFDTFSTLLQYIKNPAAYGFTEVKAACCGLGDLNAKIACLPISPYCSNRKDHLFWDPFHPTERTADLLATVAVNGSPPFVFPVNARQLIGT